MKGENNMKQKMAMLLCAAVMFTSSPVTVRAAEMGEEVINIEEQNQLEGEEQTQPEEENQPEDIEQTQPEEENQSEVSNQEQAENVQQPEVTRQEQTENTDENQSEVSEQEQNKEEENQSEVSEQEQSESMDGTVNGAKVVYSGKSCDLDWTIDSEGKLTISGSGDYASKGNIRIGMVYPRWMYYSDKIKTAEVKVSNITCTVRMFLGCSALTSVDLSKLDTSKVTDMSDMFFGCSNLSNLNVSNFNTSKVTNMSDMFYGCNNLSNLNVSNFDTSKVTNMYWMFGKCSNLSNLNVSNFNTSEVTNMSGMFCECRNLSNLDVSNFDTSEVTSMSSMFACCENLSKLDVSNFNTSKVTNMKSMFDFCRNLSKLDVSNLDTSKVTNMKRMFVSCDNLSKLDVSNFDTSKVTDMSDMFSSCNKLTDLDISGFKMDNCSEDKATNMIAWCENLKSIKVAPNFKVSFDLGKNDNFVWKDGNGKVCTSTVKNLPVSMLYTRYAKASKKEFASGKKYGGYTFVKGKDGKTRCYDANRIIVTNEFKFDGDYTYYFQADGTAMTDRLTYHPDGEHIIYFDKKGHEVFNSFQYCPSVGYTCYFDSQGYLYKDKITFLGDKVYYLNGNGKLECEGWFRFANGVDFGWANSDGTLRTNGFSYDPYGRVVFYHWNGMVARGLITDGVYYYSMDMTDGHYLGQFPVN